MHSWLVSYPGLGTRLFQYTHLFNELLVVLYRWHYLSYMVRIWLFPALFQLAVTFFMLLSACIDSLSLLPAPCVVSEACLHTREREIFGLLLARVVQKVYGKTGPFSHILCIFFRAIRRYIDRADRSRRNKM